MRGCPTWNHPEVKHLVRVSQGNEESVIPEEAVGTQQAQGKETGKLQELAEEPYILVCLAVLGSGAGLGRKGGKCSQDWGSSAV